MAEQARGRRRTFWPVVLLGVAGSGLAAIAGAKDWKSLGLPKGAATGDAAPQLDSPATTALALVALAAWGVLLVTRGWVRRVLAVLAALAALGAAITAFTRPDTDSAAVRSFVQFEGAAHITTTVWPWVALVASVAALAAAVLALLWTPHWPEMGRKYDAPTTGPALPDNLEDADNIDLWKTISEGHDPTSERD